MHVSVEGTSPRSLKSWIWKEDVCRELEVVDQAHLAALRNERCVVGGAPYLNPNARISMLEMDSEEFCTESVL